MQKPPAKRSLPPAWIWPRDLATTPNGLQRLGRVLHWGLSSLAVILAFSACVLAAGPLLQFMKIAPWELVGLPVPDDVKLLELTLHTPYGPKLQGVEPANTTDSEFRRIVGPFILLDLATGRIPQDQVAAFERIAREKATSDWKVTRKRTKASQYAEREITSNRAQERIETVWKSVSASLTLAFGCLVGAVGAACSGRGARYVISGE